MIKNLIGTVGMTLIGTIPTNRIDTLYVESTLITQPTSKTNIYTETEYDQNNQELIDYSKEIATIQYDEINKNSIHLTQRAIVLAERWVADSEYILNYETLIEIDTNLNRENMPTTLLYDLSIPESNNILSKYYQIGSLQNLNSYQEDFLNGVNYNSYGELSALTLSSGATLNQQQTLTNYQINVETSDYKYLYLKIQVNYVVDSLDATTGVNILDNKNLVNTARYNIEYTVNIDPSQYEVIDIAGLMFQILGMPFAWFSIAFNFTLFPGTPYAINISHLLLGLLVSLIAIVIFRQIMKSR